MTIVELKTFTFSTGSKLYSIYNDLLGPILERLLFTIVKNTDFIGSLVLQPLQISTLRHQLFFAVSERETFL